MIPHWPTALSWLSVALGILCVIYIIMVVRRNPRNISLMNHIWQTFSFLGHLLTIVLYRKNDPLAARKAPLRTIANNDKPSYDRYTSFPLKVAKGTLQCGSGCVLGNIAAMALISLFPSISIWLGWQTLFDKQIFSVWILSYFLAFLLAISFQYLTIQKTRNSSFGNGIIQAIKADFLPLTFWQVGVYGFMAFAHFYLFPSVLGHPLRINTIEFWFMIQVAMAFGFIISYPVNWWLIKLEIKGEM